MPSVKHLVTIALIAMTAVTAIMVITTVSSARIAPSQASLLPRSSESGADAEQKRREALDRSVYALEVEAQRHEMWFYRRWDQARHDGHTFASLGDLGFSALRIGKPQQAVPHEWDISVTRWTATASDPAVDGAGWKAQLAAWDAAGFKVVESEWHQPVFDHPEGKPAHSAINMLVHAVNADGRRLVLKGRLEILWREAPVANQPPIPDDVTVAELNVIERRGAPAFTEIPAPANTPDIFGHYRWLVPTLVYDLDHDGLPEIVLPAENRLLRNRGGMRFEPEPLCPQELAVETGVIADFDNDGLPDLLLVDKHRVSLLHGLPGGRFSPPLPAADIPDTTVGQTMTAADIDGDGDLDVLLSQYLEPYRDGQMPTPYYDSNDGYPFYLLINDGHGHFTDGTVGSGLEAKRHRRVSVASFIDLNEDSHPDLVLTNDFAGNDIFFNDGHGHFKDVTNEILDEAHNFGMGHTFADFDGDGQIDLYLIGMSSTTARRLEAMKAGVKEFPEHQKQRPAMGYGNRMFLNQGPGKPFKQAPWKEQVNRTGWSWGAVSPDFDNDGDRDIYVGNGFVSAATSQDYCTSFWRHDIYSGSSKPDPGLNLFFKRDTDFGKVSWNGYEHNVLYLNEPAADGGRSFLNIAHLMGVACEYDSRSVVSTDFDGDGKADLLVEERNSQKSKRYLHLYRNDWPTTNHWVGIRLEESAGGVPLPDTRVTVLANGKKQVGVLVNGDSFLCQHPAMLQMGLGATTTVEALEIRWSDGQITRLDKPAADTWHKASAPKRRAAP